MDRINKTFASEIKQIGEEQDRVLRFITSTESEDRDGDIIEIDGWKLDNYMKNPVILYGHNYEGLPVGKSISIQKDSINKKLIQDVKFPTKDEYEFADTVYRLAKAGYLNATSVGFIGIQSEPRLDEKGNYLGKKYKKQELLETSIVPVPSNPTALMEARSKGIINEKELNELEQKSVIPYKKYPLADEGTSWNGPTEIAAASVEDLKQMCAWYDAENAENKGAYKLPHHTQSDKKTVWRAVAAAMAALLGARGGVDIPTSDKQGVYNHLAKHYADFEKEPPEFKSYSDIELKSMFEHEEKVGASISAKNMEMMQEAMNCMQEAMDIMNQMMSGGTPEPPGLPEQDGCKPKKELIEITEIKTALEEIKSQVLLLSQKSVSEDANKDINLDAIELPKAEKDAAHNELEIKPEELKELVSQIIKEQIEGGN